MLRCEVGEGVMGWRDGVGVGELGCVVYFVWGCLPMHIYPNNNIVYDSFIPF